MLVEVHVVTPYLSLIYTIHACRSPCCHTLLVSYTHNPCLLKSMLSHLTCLLYTQSMLVEVHVVTSYLALIHTIHACRRPCCHTLLVSYTHNPCLLKSMLSYQIRLIPSTVICFYISLRNLIPSHTHLKIIVRNT